jgi:hypothetical protein
MLGIKNTILKTKKNNQYQVEDIIGNGTYGLVYKVRKISDTSTNIHDQDQL